MRVHGELLSSVEELMWNVEGLGKVLRMQKRDSTCIDKKQRDLVEMQGHLLSTSEELNRNGEWLGRVLMRPKRAGISVYTEDDRMWMRDDLDSSIELLKSNVQWFERPGLWGSAREPDAP